MIKRYSYYVFFVIAVVLLGCNKSPVTKAPNTQRGITLIFDTIKANYDTLEGKWTTINTKPVLTFRTSNPEESIVIIRKPQKDTFTIETRADWVMVSYRFNPVSTVDFVVKKGDTVRINEKHVTPFLSIGRKNVRPYDINYHYYRKARYGTVESWSTEDALAQPSIVYNVLQGLPWQAHIQSAREKQLDELKDETTWLDSLRNVQLLSEPEYNIWKFRNKYRLKYVELASMDLPDLEADLKTYKDSIMLHDCTGDYERYYMDCLYKYSYLKLKETAETVRLSARYDFLDTLSIPLGTLSDKIKQLLVEGIIRQYPLPEAQSYYKRYTEQMADTVLKRQLADKYRYLLDDTVNQSADIELIDTQGRRMNWTEVLKKHKGKMIYVDFWASWCAPCKKEMPASHRLRERYEGKDVVFVYLSIDQSEEAWKQCLPQVGLDSLDDNYLVLNSRTSKIMKEELRIKSIPRYLIYNREGRLVNDNAPRPSDKRIENLLQ